MLKMPQRATPVPLPGVALLVVLLVLALIGAGSAVSDEPSAATHPVRAAVLAATDATPADIAAATTAARADGAEQVVVVRPVGQWDTQARAAALATEGYAEVVAAGAQARTAVAQAQASELAAGTRWRTSA